METEMNGERLSALVDGELSKAEYGPAVDAINQSPELKQRWMRYHLGADVLKKSLPPVLLKPEFSARVMQAINAEPTVLAPRNIFSKLNLVAKQIAGLAIAASVTAVVIFGVQIWRVQPSTDPAAVVHVAPLPVINVSGPVVTSIPPGAADNAPLPAHVQLQINQYLLNHNYNQNALAAQRMLPYARIVGHTDTAAE